MSTRPSAYQWDFCLEREIDYLQEWEISYLSSSSPFAAPIAGLGGQQDCLEGSRSSSVEAGGETL